MGLTIILVICIVALLVLVLILACIVYVFRKNKLNAVQQAIARRNSSLKKEAERPIGGLTESQMEGKKAAVVDIFQDSDKKGLVPSILPQDEKDEIKALADNNGEVLIAAPSLNQD